jgi:hypothetical protein
MAANVKSTPLPIEQGALAVSASAPVGAGRSGIPLVQLLFICFLKSGTPQIAIRVLEHIKRFRYQGAATDLLRSLHSFCDQGLLEPALAMGLGGRRRHQISEILENT